MLGTVKGPAGLPSSGMTKTGGRGTSANSSVSVTKSDSKNLDRPLRGLYVGGAGDISVQTTDDRAVVFKAVAVGPLDTGPVKRINSTGTTATDIVGFV
jgi:hypothetical protein